MSITIAYIYIYIHVKFLLSFVFVYDFFSLEGIPMAEGAPACPWREEPLLLLLRHAVDTIPRLQFG
eukprot:SAG22_NODE_1245_length_5020_cov_1.424304_1_plen_66_part_00